MFYLWRNSTDKRKKFFNCDIEQFEGFSDIPWITGEKINRDQVPQILRYYAQNSIIPEDFPYTSSVEFLVSNKIVSILQKFDIPNIDYFESVIIQPNGNQITGYCTLNILNVIDCLDEKKSKFITTGSVSKYYSFKSIALFEKRIPEEIKLFRLKDHETLIIVDEGVRQEFIKQKVTGVSLTPVIEGDPVLGKYDEYEEE